mmetsp:Transcript_59472/g.110070  ORF Transcript_59472/g.110070 Transcript_59472/m.110070 type:complete len:280 (+) Transcript_59472:117-956(+)
MALAAAVPRVGFIGAGMMAEAMLGGLIGASTTKPELVTISEPVEARRDYIAGKFGVRIAQTNVEVCQNSDVVVMAVKPQVLDSVLADLRDKWTPSSALMVSIVAGKTLACFQSYLPSMRVARVMPNTPALVGCGAAAYVTNSLCGAEDAKMVETIMGSCGICERVHSEDLLDAVTGLSGSGPAYVYMLIEAMSDGGVRMGLPRAVATRLAAQTVMGSGKMVCQGEKHPGELKDAVTSPGGTTIAGVQALETGAFRGTVMAAVQAATKRSQELGRGLPPS